MREAALIFQKRKTRADVSAFGALLATPAEGLFQLPANARIAFRSLSGVEAGSLVAVIDGPAEREIRSPGMVAGDVLVLDRVEKGSSISPAAGIDVMLDIGLGRWAKIGEAE